MLLGLVESNRAAAGQLHDLTYLELLHLLRTPQVGRSLSPASAPAPAVLHWCAYCFARCLAYGFAWEAGTSESLLYK